MLKRIPAWVLLVLYPAAVVGAGLLFGWVGSRADACIWAFLGTCAVLPVVMAVGELRDRRRGWRVEVHRGEVVKYARFAGRWEAIGFDVEPRDAGPVLLVGGIAHWAQFPVWAREARATILERLRAEVGAWCVLEEGE